MLKKVLTVFALSAVALSGDSEHGHHSHEKVSRGKHDHSD